MRRKSTLFTSRPGESSWGKPRNTARHDLGGELANYNHPNSAFRWTADTTASIMIRFSKLTRVELRALPATGCGCDDEAHPIWCQSISKTGPALWIVKCYRFFVSRHDRPFHLSAFSFRLIASPPAAARLGLFDIPWRAARLSAADPRVNSPEPAP